MNILLWVAKVFLWLVIGFVMGMVFLSGIAAMIDAGVAVGVMVLFGTVIALCTVVTVFWIGDL